MGAPGCPSSSGCCSRSLALSMYVHARRVPSKINLRAVQGCICGVQPAGAKHYASVLLCDHPTAPYSKSIRDCGFEWSVFTHWHTRRICYTLVTLRVFVAG